MPLVYVTTKIEMGRKTESFNYLSIQAIIRIMISRCTLFAKIFPKTLAHS